MAKVTPDKFEQDLSFKTTKVTPDKFEQEFQND
jgi:hypothetical protein